MVRGFVGVARYPPSRLVIMVPGRPSTAAAFTGVPFRIACIIRLSLPRELGLGMREGCGKNTRDSRGAGAAQFSSADADIRDGVGGFKER